jgi:hypothetical protein
VESTEARSGWAAMSWSVHDGNLGNFFLLISCNDILVNESLLSLSLPIENLEIQQAEFVYKALKYFQRKKKRQIC